MLQIISYYIGLTTLLYLSFQFLRFLYLHFRPSSLPKYHHGLSPWALITGASDGIGLALAYELASNHFNLILHGRNPTKLEHVRTQLNALFPNISIRIAVADASSPDSSTEIRNILTVIQDLHLTVLVNNVGGSGPILQPAIKTFEDHTSDEISKLINLNLVFPTQLTHSLLPVFAKIAGPKLILNIGSLAASGAPYAAVYGGCKAFNHAWSKGLQAEAQAAGQGIEVLGIVVGSVTETAHVKTASSLATPNAKTMARAALQKVGCGRAEVVGYWSHAVQYYLLGWVPDEVQSLMKVGIMERVKLEEEKSH
ncbi:MAG: hypothetical protein Q9225_001035 [Loekoesia sp. 1 TL-2023]